MKHILALFLTLLMLTTLIACDTPAKDDSTNASALPETTEYPITLTDAAGRSVIIEDEPQTLVSGYYISTSAIIALDLDQRMVGIEAKADKRPIYRLSAPALIELPNVGTAKEFDLEGCAALNPDLVILPLKLKDAASSLEALGIDVLLVNPEKELYRRFTPREAARIQSFPDSFEFVGSEADAYRQIGNAIPPVMFWHITKQVAALLNTHFQNNND